jgi:UDP-N-acetylmuramyl pentapeptide phosphotransferase/UDP-N-acetylglucosamine-1-phosphate transferase
MNDTLRLVLLIAVGSGLAVCAMVLTPARWRRRLTVINHANRPVPATLGIALFAGSALAQLIAGLLALIWGTELGHDTWGLLAGAVLVFAAGLVDDLRPGGPRGLFAHGRELLRGRITTGLLKVVAGIAGAVLVVLTLEGRSPAVMVAGVLLIAGAANVWNGLDVRPGRAGKAFVLGALPMMFLGPPAILARLLGAELAAVWPDLRERGMLGDAGSNLLGFVLGAAAYVELTGVGVIAAAAVAIGLNLLAETVTFSRCIDAVPPLRWLDRLGRSPADAPPVLPDAGSRGGPGSEPQPAGLPGPGNFRAPGEVGRGIGDAASEGSATVTSRGD